MLRNAAGRVVGVAQRTAAFQPSFLRFVSVFPDVGDYEEIRREFHLHVPRHFNFCTVLDRWAAVEKVNTVFPVVSVANVKQIYILQCIWHLPGNCKEQPSVLVGG